MMQREAMTQISGDVPPHCAGARCDGGRRLCLCACDDCRARLEHETRVAESQIAKGGSR